MSRQSCPTQEELRAFELGDLPEGELEAVGAHLESCPHCEAAIRAMDTLSDAVVAAYRQSALAAPLPTPAVLPQQVGDYEILEELGQGGMGVVYKARHGKLGRVVALKMLLGGAFITSEERARFRIEAAAVARLRHPNIVQIYEVGEHDVGAGQSRPYFTLELAPGGSLDDRLDGRPQPPRQAAAWLEVVARAAHYAHEHGIVHRDLKPSNVLLSEAGQPMICDFGVAKLMTGSDVKTLSGTLLGTAEYMAPEQAAGSSTVGPAADTYALGAILYTMLTGRPPFQGSSTLHVLEQVCSQEPVPPRRLVPQVPRDLETICLKCLQKEPAHRYGSAAELADDFGRFLSGEPIRARPATFWERGWKWAKRRPTVAALLAAVVMLTAIGVSLMLILWRGAETRAREEARGRRENLHLLANVTLDHGLNLCGRGEVSHGLLLLAHALALAEQADASELAHAARVNLASWRRRLVTLRAHLHHDDWVWAVAFSPDARTAFTGGKDSVARRWDTATGQLLGEIRHPYPVWSVAVSPNGKTLLTGCGEDERGEVRLWDASTGEPLGPPLSHPEEVHAVAFSPNGQRFLTVCDKEVRVWHLDNGRPTSLALPHPQPPKRIERIQPRLWAIFSPDSQSVLTGGEDGSARLWDAATGAARGKPLRHDGPVLSLAFSPSGKKAVTGSHDGTARIWDLTTFRQCGPNLTHLGMVHAVTVRFDEAFVATGSSVEDRDLRTGTRTIVGGEVRLWRMETGELFGKPLRHSESVWSVAFRTGGGKLLAGGRDRLARFYSLFDGSLMGKPLDHEGTVPNVVFSPTGTLALTGSAGGYHSANGRLWELAPGDPVVWSAVTGRVDGVKVRVTSFLPDGSGILGVAKTQAREYKAVTGQPAGPPLEHTFGAAQAVYSPDGQYIFSIGEHNKVYFWKRGSEKPLHEKPSGELIESFAFSDSGDLIAVGRVDGRVEVCRLPTGEAQGPLIELPPGHFGLTFRPDGQALYTHDVEGGNVQEWEVRTGKVLRAWKAPGTVRYVRVVAGKLVAVLSQGRHLTRVWDLENDRALSGPLSDIVGQLGGLDFSPDGRCLLVGLTDYRTATLWDLATGKPIGPPVYHNEGGIVVAFTADGKRMLSGSEGGEFRSQQVPVPVPGDCAHIRCWVEVLTGMELDSQGTIRDLGIEELQARRRQLERMGGPPDGVGRP